MNCYDASLNEIRRGIAKQYISEVIDAMEGHCLDGYVFGSVARKQDHANSDIDIILIVKKPKKEEIRKMNAPEELKKRKYCLNFAHNSHRIFEIWEETQERTGQELSVYAHFKERGRNAKIYLHAFAAVPFCELVSDAVPYSKL